MKYCNYRDITSVYSLTLTEVARPFPLWPGNEASCPWEVGSALAERMELGDGIQSCLLLAIESFLLEMTSIITVAGICLVLLTAAQDWGRKYLQRLYYQLLS